MKGPEARKPVTVSLDALISDSISFEELEDAFGPSSLGILLVKDLPKDFGDLRMKLLSFSSHLACLPAEELDKLSRPEAKYLVGWSHGKETLKTGKYDTLKGSYYSNCAFYQDPSLQNAPADDFPDFPEYTAPNVWPPESLLPSFRETFEDLCTLIIDTAVLVAKACDRYASVHIEDYPANYLEHVVGTSMTTKARLLHYFPPESKSISGPLPASTLKALHLSSHDSATEEGEDIKEAHDTPDSDSDSWCATHIDHGCLTGLTSALYIDETDFIPPTSPANPSYSNTTPSPSSSPSSSSSSQTDAFSLNPLVPLLQSPDPTAGLYIQSRTNETIQISIPPDCLAFQTGEALQLITAGRFQAVPHFVKGPGQGHSHRSTSGGGDGLLSSSSTGQKGRRVARNTLAVFTQPNLDEVVDRERGTTFAEFARGVVARHT